MAEIDTLPKVLVQDYHKYGSKKVALRAKEFGIWREYSWKEYYEIVKYSSLGLASLGLERGDKVSILGDTEAVTSALRLKRELKLSSWELIRGSLGMAKVQKISLAKVPLIAVSTPQLRRAVEEGDLDTGIMLVGQGGGAITDMPSCSELIEQTIAQAEEALETTREKMSS